MPEGHFPIARHMSVPVFDKNGIVAIIGVGNKEEPYNSSDMRQLSLYMNSTWDVIKQKRYEEEKENYEARLQQAQKMEAIGTLAGGIAHDFNNILGAILGYADMAYEDAPPDSSIKGQLEMIIKSGERAGELVRHILAFSRQSRIGRISLKMQPIVKEALKMLRSSIPATITIRQRIDSNCPIILADPIQIHQILMNLCTNAFHAMEDRGGILDIELQTRIIGRDCNIPGLEPGEYVGLRVADTGSGMSPDIMSRIFDPYFTTKEQGKGTGMGLAIVHGVISEYGGAVSVESRPGEGSAFHLYFPVDSGAESARPQKKEDGFIPGGHEHILFIDDEQLLCDLAQKALEKLGYTVTVKYDGKEGLEYFQSAADVIDVVVTDQTMPGMTGTDLAARLLDIRPELPIILCTGYSKNLTEESAGKIGIQAFVTKPMISKDMARVIRKVLDEKSDGRVADS